MPPWSRGGIDMDFKKDKNMNEVGHEQTWQHNLIPPQFQRQLIAAAHLTDGKSDSPGHIQAIRLAEIDRVVEQLRAMYPQRFKI